MISKQDEVCWRKTWWETGAVQCRRWRSLMRGRSRPLPVFLVDLRLVEVGTNWVWQGLRCCRKLATSCPCVILYYVVKVGRSWVYVIQWGQCKSKGYSIHISVPATSSTAVCFLEKELLVFLCLPKASNSSLQRNQELKFFFTKQLWIMSCQNISSTTFWQLLQIFHRWRLFVLWLRVRMNM